MEDLWNVLVAVYVTSSVLIIAANLAIISVILYSPNLRHKSKNLVIVSIALADLLMGCFVTPMVATTLRGTYTADCHTRLALQLIGDHGIFFIVGWNIITFSLLHLKESNVQCPWKSLRLPVPKYVKIIALVSWPWLATLCVLVPLVVINAPVRAFYFTDDVMCIMLLPQTVLIIVCFLSLYLPFYACVAALVTVVVCYSNGCHRDQPTTLMGLTNTQPSQEATEHAQEQSSSSRENPLVVTVPITVYLVCYMPLIVVTWLHFSDIYTPKSVYGMTIFGVLTRSVILPMSWLIFKDIRHELKVIYSRLKRFFSLCISNPPPSTSSAVSFSRLQEIQNI